MFDRAGFLRRALRHRSFAFGGLLTAIVVGMALLSLFWTPYSTTAINIRRRLAPPSAEHWLGTDAFGRDVLSLILAGAQNSLFVAIVSVGIGLLLGSALGLLASARRGWIEELVMRMADFTYAFPAILSAIMFAAILGPRTINSIIAIAIFNIPVFARVVRASANAIWARDFILAARSAGKGLFRITIEHVLPNILAVIVVQATIQFALAILAEAALSYLGLGTQPPTPSWGRMLNDAQTYVFRAPLLSVFPGLAIAISVLGLNLLGDGLRDLTDPRLARQR
ncbi:ABC transporter permease [uncultured Ferrovibrio sp.]|jgi:peptide/nickel transport system permease protein|uniref:ABC transporter permease n=1 Tax=uncultured Ferrovibrio sp. TaxID=1576913 RepID=UPI002616D081|nr:ABC transporter permease [uncultured Ferrovibrio sp.]